MSAVATVGQRASGNALRQWLPAALSAAGAVGLALYLALRNYQVDIDVYRMGGQHALLADLYSAQLPKGGLLFTYPPFAALVFALLDGFSASGPCRSYGRSRTSWPSRRSSTCRAESWFRDFRASSWHS